MDCLIRRIGQSRIQLLRWFHRPMNGAQASGAPLALASSMSGLLLGGGRDEFGELFSKLSSKQEHNTLQLCRGGESRSISTNSTIGISPDPDASPCVDGFGAPGSVPCPPSKAPQSSFSTEKWKSCGTGCGLFQRRSIAVPAFLG